MMNDQIASLALAGFGFAGFVVAAMAVLKGWHGWLEVKRLEIGGRGGTGTAERIEMADLKERIRKLEAIASCVDL